MNIALLTQPVITYTLTSSTIILNGGCLNVTGYGGTNSLVIQMNSLNPFNAAGGSCIELSRGGTITLGAANLTMIGGLAGTGAGGRIQLSDATGRLNLNGVNTVLSVGVNVDMSVSGGIVTAPTTVLDIGARLIPGHLTYGGAVAAFTGKVSLIPGSSVVFVNNGNGYGQLSVTGSIALNAATFVVAGTFLPTIGTTFLAITATTGVNGLFQTFQASQTVVFNATYTATTVTGIRLANFGSSAVYVSPVGTDTACGTPSTPCRTIAQALQVAGASLSVVLLPGVYTGVGNCDVMVTIGVPAITLSSQNGSALTFIDCGLGSRAFDLCATPACPGVPFVAVTITGVTFRNCNTTSTLR